MKIAISTDGDYVSAHFGRCPSFTIIEIEDKKIISKKIIDNPGHHPGYLPQFLHEMGAEYIIAGGMGQNAQMLFDRNGIKTVMGITGKIEEVLDRICDGTIQGGESLCNPGAGKGYGIDKTECDHGEHDH